MSNHDDINSINTCHHSRSLLAGSQSSPDYLYVNHTECDTFFPIFFFAQPRHVVLPEDFFTLSVLPLPQIFFTESHLVVHCGLHLSLPCYSGHRGPPRSSFSSGSFFFSQGPLTQSQHHLCTLSCAYRWYTSKCWEMLNKVNTILVCFFNSNSFHTSKC